jgi:hypothetical protein
MPLTLRPTGLGSGIDKDHPDYTIYCGAWDCRPHLRDRLMTVNGPMTRLNRVATLEDLKRRLVGGSS